MEIRTNNIAVEINGRYIFNNLNILLNGNKIFAITGESGSGKTTLLNCLGLIQNISNGTIFINGKNATSWSDGRKTKFWHESASFIYQDYGIIDNESVFYNVTLNKNKPQYQEAAKVLHLVGLAGRGNDRASVLSGGEKQRLGIARAIYKNAKIIYADEPTASLDSKNRMLVVDLLKKMRNAGAMVINATHDERLMAECDDIINIERLSAPTSNGSVHH